MSRFVPSSPLANWIVVVASIAALGVLDYASGPEFHLFIFYFVPIGLAAWRIGLVGMAIASFLSAAMVYAALALAGLVHPSQVLAVWNAATRLVAFLAMGGATWKARDLLDRERRVTARLRQALSEVKVLEGLLPICASCKKIKDEGGNWQGLESCLQDRSGARFTHGICPECARELMREAGMAAPGDRAKEPEDPVG